MDAVSNSFLYRFLTHRKLRDFTSMESIRFLLTFHCNYRHNPVGKVLSREEVEKIAALCVKYSIIILSDEVYDRLFYVPFTRISTISPEVSRLTITVGSAGKNFYATGWRVGYLIGEEHLIKYAAAAHTRICYSSVAPLQAAAAIGFEKADQEGFWDQSRQEMRGKVERFCKVFDELNIPVSNPTISVNPFPH